MILLTRCLPWMFHNSEKHNVRDSLKEILSARLMRQRFLLLINLCIHYFSFISLISFWIFKKRKVYLHEYLQIRNLPFLLNLIFAGESNFSSVEAWTDGWCSDVHEVILCCSYFNHACNLTLGYHGYSTSSMIPELIVWAVQKSNDAFDK